MFSNVLIGVDGRQGGRDAIALARQLAAPGASFTLAHVYNSDWLLGSRSGVGVPFEREDAERLLREEREAAAIDAALATDAYASAGRGLHVLAEERRADLLVVGSSRHALLGLALIADDARAALNGAPCAVAVAPRGYTQMRHAFGKLGVGYDTSPESNAALAAAREIARRHGATITALWVVSLPYVQEEKPLPADWPKDAETLVGRCLSELNALDGVKGDAVYGGTREELAKLSDRVDLLVVGSRGYGPMRRMFQGSVSTYLLRHAACPLLVLPRTVAPQPEDSSETEVRAESPAVLQS